MKGFVFSISELFHCQGALKLPMLQFFIFSSQSTVQVHRAPHVESMVHFVDELHRLLISEVLNRYLVKSKDPLVFKFNWCHMIGFVILS